MHLVRRITASLSAIVAIAILTSCSTDGSGTLTGPGERLDRKPIILSAPEGIPSCRVQAKNVFIDETDLPFVLECEDMNEAVHTITSEYSNGHGCVMEIEGSLMFPSTGHMYTYAATRDHCTLIGGKMTVCGPGFAKCIKLSLPAQTAVSVDEMQAPLR